MRCVGRIKGQTSKCTYPNSRGEGRRKMNTTMLKRNGVIAAAVVAVACLLALPGNAYAADIENTISSSKSSVSVGQSATLSCQTTYAMWGLGPLGVPFMSDWLTEIPYAYYSKPSVTSYTGSTNGGWSQATAIRTSGSVWRQKTSPSWFYGKTVWSGKYTIKATAASGSSKSLAHGQTTHSDTSEGATAFTYVKTIK